MRRRRMFSTVGVVFLSLMLPLLVYAKQEAVTLEVTGMT